MTDIDYSLPRQLVLALVWDALFSRHRSFRADAHMCADQLNPTLKIIGKENIPQIGPCVVTVNHYCRPGFSAWWLALGIAACVPIEMYWVMTGELTYPGKWYAPLGMSVSKFVLARLAHVYGFTTMPPMPPRPKDVEARARAALVTLQTMRNRKNVLLGLAPEGGDQPGGKLTLPPPGAGRFGLLLAGLKSEFVPVAAYESDGRFCLNFGASYRLNIPPGLSADEKDRAAAQIMVSKIAALLPSELRGEFV